MRAQPWIRAAALAFIPISSGSAFAPQAPTAGGVTYANVTSTPIADNATTSSTITVSGASTSILDANLQTFITHTNPADLDITLTSPAGTIATISTDNGGPSADVFGVFVERGSVAVSAAGRQVLLRAGQGTNIPRPGDAPTPPAVWGAARVQAALQSVE